MKIPYDKPYIILKGEGKRKTQIVWGDYFSTAQSPTFTSLADNTVAKSISFVVSNITNILAHACIFYDKSEKILAHRLC